MSQISERTSFVGGIAPSSAPPPRPTGVSAQWIKRGDDNGVNLSWDAADPSLGVKGYMVEADLDRSGSMTNVSGKDPVPGNSFFYKLREPMSLQFYIYAIGPTGRRSQYVEYLALAPGRTLPPCTLYDCKVDNENLKLTCIWNYAAVAGVKGFHIFQDGKLVADTDVLGPSVRRWTTDTLKRGQPYEFTIEAVGTDGTTSEMGPAIKYKFFNK